VQRGNRQDPNSIGKVSVVDSVRKPGENVLATVAVGETVARWMICDFRQRAFNCIEKSCAEPVLLALYQGLRREARLTWAHISRPVGANFSLQLLPRLFDSCFESVPKKRWLLGKFLLEFVEREFGELGDFRFERVGTSLLFQRIH
jgi:hypothetical protein